MLKRLHALRHVEDDDSIGRPNDQHEDDAEPAPVSRPDNILISREIEELKSENTALKLQHNENQREIDRLRLQHENDQREIDRLQQFDPILQPPPPPPPTGHSSRKKKKKKENAATAATTITAAATAVAATTTTTAPAAATSLPTIHLYHDSNADDKFLNKDNIQYTLDLINKKNNKQTTKYNIQKHATYELQQTFNKIKQTTYRKDDIVVINVLTNDARTTKRRPPKTLHQTEHFLNAIYNHLLSQLSPDHVILLESPPLLYEDIFPHSTLSHQIARRRGIRFAPTLIGEPHIQRFDGVHLQKGSHHLLAKAIACAILRQNPHRLFGLGRPPQGDFGPWLAPRGQGMVPPSYSGAATKPPPYQFRRQISRPSRPARPLMSINIPLLR